MKTTSPFKVVEWIPYNDLKNIEFLTKGGCSEIYTGVWVNGKHVEWDTKKSQLKRFGAQPVNQSWFEEVYNLKLLINNFFYKKKNIKDHIFIL